MKTQIEIRDLSKVSQVFEQLSTLEPVLADRVTVQPLNFIEPHSVITLEGPASEVRAVIQSVDWTGIDYGVEIVRN